MSDNTNEAIIKLANHDYAITVETLTGRKTKAEPNPAPINRLTPVLADAKEAAGFLADLINEAEARKAGTGLLLATHLLAKQVKVASDEAENEAGEFDENKFLDRLVAPKNPRTGLTGEELQAQLLEALAEWGRLEPVMNLQSTNPGKPNYATPQDRLAAYTKLGFKTDDEYLAGVFKVNEQMRHLHKLINEEKVKKQERAAKREENAKKKAAAAPAPAPVKA